MGDQVPRRPDIPDYTLIRVIGSGSYGDVWLAHGLTGTYRALKVLWRDRFASAEPFEREFRGLQRFAVVSTTEPRQLAVLHVGRASDETFFYYVMELADDRLHGTAIRPWDYAPRTLRAVLEESRTLPTSQVVQLGIDLATALSTLHRHGLVHRDIKPSNVILVAGVPKLADVGLVAEVGRADSLVGTPGFIAPEGPGKPAADLYALGKLLYELATGRDRTEYPLLPEGLGEREDRSLWFGLNEVIHGACETNPAHRYSGADAMLADLRLLQAEKSPRLIRAERQRGRLRRALAIAIPLLGLAGALALREYRLNRRLATQLYRTNIERAALTLERERFGEARLLLGEPPKGRAEGLEQAVLRRQARGDLSEEEWPTGPGPVDALAFDSRASRLAVLYLDRDYTLQVRRLPGGAVLWAASNIVELAGFLGADSVAATVRNPLDPQGSRALAVVRQEGIAVRLEGQFLPAGIVAGGEVIAAEGTAGWRFGSWTPGESHWKEWTPWTDLPGEPLHRLTARVSAEGRRWMLCAGVGDGDSYTSILAVAGGNSKSRVLAQFWGRTVEEGAAALSSDGSRAAVALAQDGAVKVYDIDSGEIQASHTHAGVRTLAFSPNSKWLASAGDDEALRIFEATPGGRSRAFLGHGSGIEAVAWKSDGSGLASGDRLGVVRVWPASPEPDSADLEVWPGFKAGGQPGQLIVSAAGSLVAVSARTNALRVLSAASLDPNPPWIGPHIPIAFSSDEHRLWAVAEGTRLVSMQVANGSKEVDFPAFPDNAPVQLASGSPDGQHAVLVDGGDRVALWALDERSARRVAVGEAHTRDEPAIADIAFDAKNRLALTCGAKAAVIWDLDTGAARRIESPHRVLTGAFLPGGTRCLLGLEDQGLSLVELNSDPVRWTSIACPLNAPILVLPLPEEDRIVVGGEDGRLAFLRLADLEPLGWLQHRGLRSTSKRHTLARLVYLPRPGRLLGLTEEGILVRW